MKQRRGVVTAAGEAGKAGEGGPPRAEKPEIIIT